MLLDFGLAKELPETFRAGVAGLSATSALETKSASAQSLRDVADLILRVGIEVRGKGSLDPETVARLREEIPARVLANPRVRISQHPFAFGPRRGA